MRFASRPIASSRARLRAELTEHLGYPPGQAPPDGEGNARNGTNGQDAADRAGPVRIEHPRDRQRRSSRRSSRNDQRRFEGFDDTIVAMYARDHATWRRTLHEISS